MWEGPSLDGILSKERSIWYGVIPLGLESAVTGPQVPPHPFTSLDPPEWRPACPVPLGNGHEPSVRCWFHSLWKV